MTPDERLLPLEGVENFRDYGGYAVPGGLRVVRGRLWRSAHHGGATDADLARIASLGLSAVVDLRRPTERANQPSRRPEGFAGRVIDCDHVLIHCTAGKDRTGLLAALTHHLLGVHPMDAAADFELTNRAARIEARLAQVTEVLTQSLGRRPSETAVRAFLGVEGAYLEAAFAAIRERSGSVESYLAGLGVDDRAAGRLRELWLEPAQA